MRTNLDLTPFLRSSVGFDRVFDLLESSAGEDRGELARLRRRQDRDDRDRHQCDRSEPHQRAPQQRTGPGRARSDEATADRYWYRLDTTRAPEADRTEPPFQTTAGTRL
jgi:hypothetical protein